MFNRPAGRATFFRGSEIMRQRFVLAVLCAFTAMPSLVAAAKTDYEPYPLDYWALRPVINAAQVSPDGKYLGIMKIPAKDANPIIEVYKAAELDKREPVFTLNADPILGKDLLTLILVKIHIGMLE